jgi:hypothetical protein
MGSPFKMIPGIKSGASRDRGLKQLAQRGLIAGGPKTHHADARSGDELPSYNVQTATHTASGSGSGSEKSTYTPPTRTAAGDAAYAALTPAERKAQDASYIAKNTKPAINANSSSTKIDSKKETLGTLTENQIKTDGEIASENRVSYNKATIADEQNLMRKDSSDTANKSLNIASVKSGGYLSPDDYVKAQEAGDNAAGFAAAGRAGFDGNLLNTDNKPNTNNPSAYATYLFGRKKNERQIAAVNKNVAAVSQTPKG